MTLGKPTATRGKVSGRHQSRKKREAALAAAFPQGIRCQKCLQYGHWSYECKGKRKILVRPSRTTILQNNLQANEDATCSNGVCEPPVKKYKPSLESTRSKATEESDGSSSDNPESSSSSCSTSSASSSESSSRSCSSRDGSSSDSDSD